MEVAAVLDRGLRRQSRRRSLFQEPDASGLGASRGEEVVDGFRFRKKHRGGCPEATTRAALEVDSAEDKKRAAERSNEESAEGARVVQAEPQAASEPPDPAAAASGGEPGWREAINLPVETMSGQLDVTRRRPTGGEHGAGDLEDGPARAGAAEVPERACGKAEPPVEVCTGKEDPPTGTVSAPAPPSDQQTAAVTASVSQQPSPVAASAAAGSTDPSSRRHDLSRSLLRAPTAGQSRFKPPSTAPASDTASKSVGPRRAQPEFAVSRPTEQHEEIQSLCRDVLERYVGNASRNKVDREPDGDGPHEDLQEVVADFLRSLETTRSNAAPDGDESMKRGSVDAETATAVREEHARLQRIAEAYRRELDEWQRVEEAAVSTPTLARPVASEDACAAPDEDDLPNLSAAVQHLMHTLDLRSRDLLSLIGRISDEQEKQELFWQRMVEVLAQHAFGGYENVSDPKMILKTLLATA